MGYDTHIEHILKLDAIEVHNFVFQKKVPNLNDHIATNSSPSLKIYVSQKFQIFVAF